MKLNVVHELTNEDVHEKMTWPQVFRHYWPSMPEDEIDFLLYEHTCFPFDHEQTLKQIYKMYKHQVDNFKIKE